MKQNLLHARCSSNWTTFPCPVPLILILSLLSLIFCFFGFILYRLLQDKHKLLKSDINLKVYFFPYICISTTHLPFNAALTIYHMFLKVVCSFFINFSLVHLEVDCLSSKY